MSPFRSYLTDVREDAGRNLPSAIILVIAGALLEGIGIVAILPFAALIIGAAETETAKVILSFMEGIGIESQLGRALALSAGFFLLLALRGLIVWKRDTKLFEMGLGYVDRWRSKLFLAIASANWSAVSNLHRTDIEHALTNDVSRLSSGTDRLLRAGAAIALAIVQLGIIALLAPFLLVLVIALIALAALVTAPLIRKAGALGHRLTRSGRNIHRVLGDFLASQKLARLNNAEQQFLDRFDGSVREVRKHQIAFFASQASARGWFQLAAGSVVIGALLVGFFVLDTPLSVLAVTLLVLARLAGPVQLIAQTGQALANTLPAHQALETLLGKLKQECVVLSASGQSTTPDAPAELTLTDISFAYSAREKPVLKSVDLTIEAGQIVALAGVSGAGKTTLLDIICGLYQPTLGEIAVDGNALSTDTDLGRWRDHLAYLPQDPFLFDSSIRENLVWSADSITDEDIWAALRTAEVSDVVKALPGGLDGRAGERGQNFSGGERQRLCIARALLRRPRLLILDEATNALDAALEDQILANLSAMRRHFSILLVTHRRETLRHADRIATLSNGAITAD